MRTALALLLGLGVVLALTLSGEAQEKKKGKEVTLKGTITCAKCELKETTKCATVIKVKEDGKDVVYYFDPAGHKKNHREICQEGKEGVVIGVVSEKDGKKQVTVRKVEFKEE